MPSILCLSFLWKCFLSARPWKHSLQTGPRHLGVDLGVHEFLVVWRSRLLLTSREQKAGKPNAATLSPGTKDATKRSH